MAQIPRPALILAAFLAACLVGTVIWLFIFVPLGGMLDSPIAGVERPLGAAMAGLFGALTVAAFYALLPATAVVICAEAKALCSLRFYLLCGAIVGIVSQLAAFLVYPLIFLLREDTPAHLLSGWLKSNLDYPRPFLAAMAAALIGGAVAGAIYWWIAGCNAGRQRNLPVTGT
jgi:hypothetical protein